MSEEIQSQIEEKIINAHITTLLRDILLKQLHNSPIEDSNFKVMERVLELCLEICQMVDDEDIEDIEKAWINGSNKGNKE